MFTEAKPLLEEDTSVDNIGVTYVETERESKIVEKGTLIPCVCDWLKPHPLFTLLLLCDVTCNIEIWVIFVGNYFQTLENPKLN